MCPQVVLLHESSIALFAFRFTLGHIGRDTFEAVKERSWSWIFCCFYMYIPSLWFLRQKNVYVVIFKTQVHMLWVSRQKCAYVVIFTTTIVFLVFLVQTPVFPKFLVPTLAQFIGSCQQKTVNKGLFRFWEKNKVLWIPSDPPPRIFCFKMYGNWLFLLTPSHNIHVTITIFVTPLELLDSIGFYTRTFSTDSLNLGLKPFWNTYAAMKWSSMNRYKTSKDKTFSV